MREPSVKLVFVVRRTIGGMRAHVLNLLASLTGDFRLYVMAPGDDGLCADVESLGAEFLPMSIPDNLSPAGDVLSIMRIRRLLKKIGPQVVHVHGNKAALIGLPAASMAGIPARILTVHNYLRYQESGWPTRPVAMKIDRFLSRYAHRIIAVSDDLAASLAEVEKIDPKKLVVVPNGVDCDYYRPTKSDRDDARCRFLGSKDGFLVVAAGRFVDFKGFEYLIQAAALTPPEVRFLLAGDGPLKDDLARQVERMGLAERFQFVGFMDDIRELLWAGDLFVLPSTREPFGIVVLEALSAGLPVVATKAGGVMEIIDHDRTGLLVRPRDGRALADAIDLLHSHPETAKRLAKAGQSMVARDYSLTNVIAKVRGVYNECLA